MDDKQMLKEYEEFAADQYMKIRSQCSCYGELQERIKNAKQSLRWTCCCDMGRNLEILMNKEIDSVLKTLPMQDSSGNSEIDKSFCAG